MSKTNLDFTAPDRAIIARTRPNRWALKGLLAIGLMVLVLVVLSELSIMGNPQSEDPLSDRRLAQTLLQRP